MSKKLHWLRLLKQAEHSIDDYQREGIPKIRIKSYQDLLQNLKCYDYPHYSNERNWKRNRKTQYKTKNPPQK